MEYSELEICEAIPEATSLIETFRAIGYSLETAIADIIDNSITAGAKTIKIGRVWNGGKSVVFIEDDGHGMNNEELVNAMRPGAQNPLADREENDLGRFGLGLKTASFSQCRKLTVISKRIGEKPVYWTWDLDYIAFCQKWNLIKWVPEEYKNALDNKESGTIVIWSGLDRILASEISKSNESAKEKFTLIFEKVRKHLSMTFHQFIEDKKISILWGSHPIEAWNPFFTKEKKTQILSVDYMSGGVTMQGFILPHKGNFSTDTAYHEAEGPHGWSGQQGFYVYRGNRLLLAGDWLGLFRKEEQYKLVRIRIDLPNKLDAEWQIDIKKSKAYPPSYCREQIEAYARSAREKGEEVYRHRGRILRQHAGHSFQPLWLDKKNDDSWSYVINRDNELIKGLKEIAKDKPQYAFDLLLKLVETNIPTKTIFIHESQEESGNMKEEKLISEDVILPALKALYIALLSQGNTNNQAKSILKITEPFNNYEDLIDNL